MTQDVMECPGCLRRTPAARARCLYCGRDLPVTEIQAAPPQRLIESHEVAFNAVLDGCPSGLNGDSQQVLATALNLEVGEAVAYISLGKRVPLARCQSQQEAELIAGLIRNCGFIASVVADEDLKLGTELVRARRVVCSNGLVHVSHLGGVLAVPASEINLLVIGFLRNITVDYSEAASNSRRRNNADIKDSFEFQSDKTILDVYAGTLSRSFRIRADAFDYSGLVQRLSFRAEMNFQLAVDALHGAAPGAAVDHDFQRVRRLLARAWPERSHTESRGVKRAGLALRPVARSSVISDNQDQFERYSRLMFLSAAPAALPELAV